ncbi:MAG: hypothetical protein DGJ47_001083, partial [Rickettsiaceae bacterium]
MSLHTPAIKRKKLYENELYEISGIKFTVREIDILSCLFNKRSEKKIGELLEISHRTVGVHTRNIMIKINANSRDDLIDYLERCRKIDALKEYYFLLVMNAIFDKFLKKIAAIIGHNQINCAVYCNHLTTEEMAVLTEINDHLKCANITLSYNQNVDYKYRLHVTGKNFTKSGQVIADKNLIINFNNSIDLSPNRINFTDEQDYYLNLTKIIQKLVDKDAATEKIRVFIEEYKSLSITQKHAYQTRMINNTNNKIILFKSNLKYLLLIAIFLIAGLVLIVKYDTFSSESEPKDFNIIEFNQAMQHHLQYFSADNVHIDQFVKNNELIIELEKILNPKNFAQIKRYFSDSSISSAHLLNYLYNLQSLSAYYLFNKHDGEKANQILFYAKKLMENYANSRSTINVNFEDEMHPNEILSELKIIKYLPQIYTRIVYMLARTYIYKKDPEDGRKYFMITKELGQKLNLFEGYLSETSGLLILDNIKAENYIKNSENQPAKGLLLNIISRYQEIDQINNDYIKDFKPYELTQETINPNRSLYSKFDRQHRILNCYNQLIQISENKEQQIQYVNLLAKLLEKFFINHPLESINTEVNTRKIAGFYNSLGNSYLILRNCNITKLNDILVQYLN